MKLPKATEKIEQSITETLTYFRFPRKYCRRIRTNSALERIMKEIRRRARVVGLPGWQLSPDALCCPTQVSCRKQMGTASLPECGPAQGSIAGRGYGGERLRNRRALPRKKRKILYTTILPISTQHGSGGQARIPMACCASTYQGNQPHARFKHNLTKGIDQPENRPRKCLG